MCYCGKRRNKSAQLNLIVQGISLYFTINTIEMEMKSRLRHNVGGVTRGMSSLEM